MMCIWDLWRCVGPREELCCQPLPFYQGSPPARLPISSAEAPRYHPSLFNSTSQPLAVLVLVDPALYQCPPKWHSQGLLRGPSLHLTAQTQVKQSPELLFPQDLPLGWDLDTPRGQPTQNPCRALLLPSRPPTRALVPGLTYAPAPAPSWWAPPPLLGQRPPWPHSGFPDFPSPEQGTLLESVAAPDTREHLRRSGLC